MMIMIRNIVQLILLLKSFPIIFALETTCPVFTGNEEVATLTYNEFKDSEASVVHIREKEEEHPISLSSFFLTRTKDEKIYHHIDCKSKDSYQYVNCDYLNTLCKVKPRPVFCVPVETSSSVIYLDLSNGTLQNIHPNTFEKISDCLQFLILNNNKISQISPKALFSLNNLLYLDVSHNRLINWDPSILENINLEYLNVSYNQLIMLDENSLLKIETVDVSNNKLLQIHLYGGENTPLKYLNASNNKIETLLLSNIIHLKILDVSWNKIKSLQQTFINSDQLETLIASNNDIQEFDVSNLKGLKFLNLSNNKIEFINSSILTTLFELDLSNNKIMLLSNMFEFSSKIFKLSLKNNGINNIPVNAFYGLKTLRTLSLKNNNLTSFKFGSFSGLIDLEMLDLSYNQLNTFEPDKLIDLNNLRKLNLDGNKCNDQFDLTDLNIKLHNLNMIGLANMFWTCEKLVKIKIELRKMNISIKYNSVPNQNNYNIDGINCIPFGKSSEATEPPIIIETSTSEESPVEEKEIKYVEGFNSTHNENAQGLNSKTNQSAVIYKVSQLIDDKIIETAYNEDDIEADNVDKKARNEHHNNSFRQPLADLTATIVENISNKTDRIMGVLKSIQTSEAIILQKLGKMENCSYKHRNYSKGIRNQAITIKPNIKESDDNGLSSTPVIENDKNGLNTSAFKENENNGLNTGGAFKENDNNDLNTGAFKETDENDQSTTENALQ